MNRLNILQPTLEITNENDENYLEPEGQLWIIGVDKTSTPFILQAPNIHWSFFDNGYEIDSLPLENIPSDLDSGVYEIKFSFWSIPYDGYEQEADHGFTYSSHKLIKCYA